MFRFQTRTKEREEVDVLEDLKDPFQLIVWNDDVNSFDWVIDTLMDVCSHAREQAEQCAWFIHHTGKYAVKHGSYEDLRKMCDEIVDRGIGATVEETS